MDFYCSFHDDDEQEGFKQKIQSYIELFSSEYQLSCTIRSHMMFEQAWFADTLIAFCCILDDKQYDEHSYNAVMNVISRTTRHIKQLSTKRSILRQSINATVGNIDIRGDAHSHVSENSDTSVCTESEYNTSIVIRKWSVDQQDGEEPVPVSHFSSKHGTAYKETPFSTIEEEKEEPEADDLYELVPNKTPQTLTPQTTTDAEADTEIVYSSAYQTLLTYQNANQYQQTPQQSVDEEDKILYDHAPQDKESPTATDQT